MRVAVTSQLQPDGTVDPPVTPDPPLPPGYEEPEIELDPGTAPAPEDGVDDGTR